MLFHIIMTHTAENCPGYNREKMPELMAAYEKLKEVAKELNVKIHFAVNAAPAHDAYALLETDSLGSVLRVLHTIPMKQDFKITPVHYEDDLVAAANELMKQK